MSTRRSCEPHWKLPSTKESGNYYCTSSTPAVLSTSDFRLIGCDGGIHAAAERIQTVCTYPVFAPELRNDAVCTPMTQVEVVAGLSLVIRVPDDMQAQRRLAR